MPKSELEDLIELYELEKAQIEASIKELLEEREYKMADQQQRGLQKVIQMLSVLHSLEDPTYETRKSLENYKTLFQDMANKSQGKNYYKERLEEIDTQLKMLSGSKRKETAGGQEFDDALFNIVEGKKTGFKLYIKKKASFWIEFSMISKTTMLIATTPIEEITEEYYFTKQHRKAFQGLGFAMNKQTGSLEYKYSTANFKSAELLKVLVGRIVFDILYYSEFDKVSFIEYHV